VQRICECCHSTHCFYSKKMTDDIFFELMLGTM